MKDKKVLLIFIKNPQKGKVKTRLAETVGDEKAYQTYLRLVNYTLDVASRVDARRQIWYSEYIEELEDLTGKPFSRFNRPESNGDLFEKKLQRGVNLGERMSNAFNESFSQGFKKVLVIGSDCPDLSSQIIEDGYDKLDQNDVVIGPSEDGGYYLIGSKRFIPELFNDISWSTETVYEETIEVLRKGNYQFTNLPLLNDIDTEDDLRKSDF